MHTISSGYQSSGSLAIMHSLTSGFNKQVSLAVLGFTSFLLRLDLGKPLVRDKACTWTYSATLYHNQEVT